MKKLCKLLLYLYMLTLYGCAYNNQPEMTYRDRMEMLKKNHPHWEDEIIRKIANKTVSIGMTKSQVASSWGYPSDINRTVTSYGTREQWVYGGYNEVWGYYQEPQYLYFEDGVLTTIQD